MTIRELLKKDLGEYPGMAYRELPGMLHVIASPNHVTARLNDTGWTPDETPGVYFKVVKGKKAKIQLQSIIPKWPRPETTVIEPVK